VGCSCEYDKVLVLHGGLFGESGVLLDEIMMANRKDYGFSADDMEQESQASDPANPTATAAGRAQADEVNNKSD
jgi:hypothetical protein